MSSYNAQIIIEPNYIIRGTIYNCNEKTLCPAAVEQFGYEYDIRIVSDADLFAGKICAALDRKHPRDLFDIKLLLDGGQAINEELLNALVVYLACSSRPINELLNQHPNFSQFESTYNQKFIGMTKINVLSEDLKKSYLEFIEVILSSLSGSHKQFLVSIANGTPNWLLLNVPNLNKLPGILWKLENIAKLIAKNPDKHKQMVNFTRDILRIN